jgi:hypothetical protein
MCKQSRPRAARGQSSIQGGDQYAKGDGTAIHTWRTIDTKRTGEWLSCVSVKLMSFRDKMFVVPPTPPVVRQPPVFLIGHKGYRLQRRFGYWKKEALARLRNFHRFDGYDDAVIPRRKKAARMQRLHSLCGPSCQTRCSGPRPQSYRRSSGPRRQ